MKKIEKIEDIKRGMQCRDRNTNPNGNILWIGGHYIVVRVESEKAYIRIAGTTTILHVSLNDLIGDEIIDEVEA